jgi:hypothetical protein
VIEEDILSSRGLPKKYVQQTNRLPGNSYVPISVITNFVMNLLPF